MCVCVGPLLARALVCVCVCVGGARQAGGRAGMQTSPTTHHRPNPQALVRGWLGLACGAHLTMAQRDWMGSMILEEVLQASAKRVVEE